jgi:hypothetical protein
MVIVGHYGTLFSNNYSDKIHYEKPEAKLKRCLNLFEIIPAFLDQLQINTLAFEAKSSEHANLTVFKGGCST